MAAEASSVLVELTSDPIDILRLVEFTTQPDCGGISFFLGTTRNSFEDKEVVLLEYEAYEDMALRQMRDLAGRMLEKWHLGRCAVVHRLGEVKVGEVSIAIGCAAVHRDAAIQATSELINEVKASVVIWKREVYALGQPEWKSNKEWQFGQV